MNCENSRNLIGPWIDGEIDVPERQSLEEHLAGCDDCRGLTEELRARHAELRAAFRSRRQAAERVAERVIAQARLPAMAGLLRRQATVVETENTRIGATAGPLRPPSRWLSLVLAAAAGFLAALVIFPPGKDRPRETGLQSRSSGNPRAEERSPNGFGNPSYQPAARMVLATGRVNVRGIDGDWRQLPAHENLALAAGSALRTDADVRCELKTDEGCVIRLNGGSEIDLRSPRLVALRRGQIWCRAPESVSLEVVVHKKEGVPHADSGPDAGERLWSFHCPASSSLLTALAPDGKLQITTSTGEVEVKTPKARRRLKPGETAVIDKDEIAVPEASDDPLLAASWIHPLLVSKGPRDPELEQRVNELLARIGKSKVAVLYEQEIRSLGESCVLPLLRYVESSLSSRDRSRRLTAMRIVADLAPAWAVGELIGLLDDDDAEIRVLAATALERLTGRTEGRRPEAWRASRAKCAEAYARWQQWWRENAARFPPPPAPLAGAEADEVTG